MREKECDGGKKGPVVGGETAVQGGAAAHGGGSGRDGGATMARFEFHRRSKRFEENEERRRFVRPTNKS
ncbi:hypothetical protein HanIR_Chr17g0882391 [Helianthus annuus]|nr:hypothetical protein HanIR_Chr17g0882391 [Helianthus annuus]